MADPTTNTSAPAPRFPFFTAALAVVVLFAFLGLVLWAYKNPNYLDPPKPEGAAVQEPEPKPDRDAQLAEVKKRNDDALAGVGAKMSLRKAHGELMGKLKGPNDALPFPTPEPPVPKTDDKGKAP